MATVNSEAMPLTTDQLNKLDEWILDYLQQHGRATPNLIRLLYSQEHGDVSRQWVSARVTRLAEHGHIERVHPEDPTYELVSDPREDNDD